MQGPGNGRAQQRSAERKEQEADAEQPAFPSEGSAGLRRRTGAGERLAGKDAVRRRSHSAVSALKEGPAAVVWPGRCLPGTHDRGEGSRFLYCSSGRPAGRKKGKNYGKRPVSEQTCRPAVVCANRSSAVALGACIGPTAPGNTLLPAELPFTVADGSILDRKKACPFPWASLERIRPGGDLRSGSP